MKPIRTEDEFNCQRCGAESDIKIEFENNTVILCSDCEKEFAEEIKERHL